MTHLRYFSAKSTLVAFLLISLALLSTSCGKHADYTALNGVWERKFDKGGGYAVVIIENGFTQYAFFARGDKNGEFSEKMRIDLKPAVTPKQFDNVRISNLNANSELNNLFSGIYEIDGSRLKMAFTDKPGTQRPSSFTAENTFSFERKGDSVDLKPKDANYIKGLMTWVYMENLADIFKNDPSIDFDNAKTLAEGAEMFEKAAKALTEVGGKVASLPVADVDNRATTFGSEYAQFSSRGSTLMQQMGQITKELNALVIRRNSDETAGKAFLDWLLGKPGQTMGEIDEELMQLKSRFEKVQGETKSFQESLGRKDQDGVQLRSALSQTYGREFPVLKN